MGLAAPVAAVAYGIYMLGGVIARAATKKIAQRLLNANFRPVSSGVAKSKANIVNANNNNIIRIITSGIKGATGMFGNIGKAWENMKKNKTIAEKEEQLANPQSREDVRQNMMNSTGMNMPELSEVKLPLIVIPPATVKLFSAKVNKSLSSICPILLSSILILSIVREAPDTSKSITSAVQDVEGVKVVVVCPLSPKISRVQVVIYLLKILRGNHSCSLIITS